MNSKIIVLITVLIISTFHSVRSYKFLGIFPYAARSHYFLGNELMKGLAEAGHDVTILTVFEEKHPSKNGKYRQIILEELLVIQADMFKDVRNLTKQQSESPFKPLYMLSLFNYMGYNISERVLTHPKTRKLMDSEEKFDIVLVPQYSLEGVKALAPYFNAHLVLFNNHAANSWMNHFVGNPSLPSFNPEMILGFLTPMPFHQRLINMLFAAITYINHNLFQYKYQDELVRKYISDDFDLNKIIYNVSLVLSNSHASLNGPTAFVPSMKEIAGFHVRPPNKLPTGLQEYLDEAKNGVIYFSMGSNSKSAELPIVTRHAIMKAFSKRKEDILWKFEDEILPGKPDNVRIEKWLPQSDLLAHPNIKLFITHGGLLSIIEAVYHAVPTVVIPVLADQFHNAKQAESFGYAEVIELTHLNEEDLSTAIEQVVSNRKYRENVQARSKMFHDRQVKPMQEAIYWLEYIIRHNGAKHLRVGYLDLAWYQYYLLDVFGFITVVVLTTVFIILKITLFIFSKISIRNRKMKTKSSKNIKEQ